ncbi:Uncharacterized protein HZ326_23334 [Fusarium oxysporum f. sp. albedinis]|nr:Uncharacterized protein HZ326_23334 [Fusarium oxysporum f. sp. albedinis]
MVSNETDFAITKEQLDFLNSFKYKEKTRLIACPEGQPASRVQHPQELRRRSLFTIPKHDALQHYNDESTT